MKSPQTYAVVFLSLLTVSAGALAWKQNQELIALRAAAMTAEERAALEKRLANAEQRARDLEARLALGLETAVSPETLVMAEAPANDGAPPERRNRPDRPQDRNGGPDGARRTALAAFMESPEAQQLMAMRERAALDSRYAALFKNLNLSPEQLEKFKTLLVDRQSAMQDVMMAARAQGLNPRDDPDGFRKLVAETQAQIDGQIRSTLGEQGFSQYQQYQQTFPQRSVVNQLQQRLSYTAAPLSDTQTEQMVQILASTAAPRASNNGNATGGVRAAIAAGGFGAQGGRGTAISNEAVTLAQSVLAPAQLGALQELQKAQQAQQQLQRAMRDAQNAMRANNRGGNSAGGTAKKPNGG